MEISRRAFVLLILFGICIRVILIATSIGTNDIVNWMAFASLVDRVGIGPAYARIAELNHPPLALLLLLVLEKMRGVTGVEIGDLLRLAQVAFDLVAVVALLSISRSLQWRSPRGVALFYFLSPVSIFVTGFHGNTDPAMVAMLLASLAFLVGMPPRPFPAGLLLAASLGIKIVPLFLVPLILCWKRDRLRLGAGLAAGSAAIFLPAVATGGPVVLQRIFGYVPQSANYGFAYLTRSIAERLGDRLLTLQDLLIRLSVAWSGMARYAVLLGILAFTFAVLRRRDRDDVALLAGCGTILLIAIVLSPGIGMQYFLWPIAFLPFAMPIGDRVAIVGAFSLAQFTMYTIWSDGFPWWYADSSVRRPDIDVVWIGNLVWLIALAITVRAITRTLRRPRLEPAPATTS